ncbi:TetR/AcrR family transcriptional regulator [Alkalicoccobacillus murimartini]|uniref:AcrR family transcriptional regulator n=1 Tax=Alkalicoccobacillus murimartini TaxID=171685 RepID=A0ABT9YJL9_9BACI|nr:TetR/AcrR family transcriptional regulator [Alkalicoccobacillus murimartini]MDQ0207721.1 AcrR family transcriptional regulator [Alkalicoccobacillus murimartini]
MKQSVEYPPNLIHIMEQTEVLIKEFGCSQTTLKKIMDKAEVSKGAIYHYVSSKDELFGLMLKKNIFDVNESFWNVLSQGEVDLQAPLKAITDGLTFFFEPASDVTNPIFIYLLSKTENPPVQQILDEFYSYSIAQASSWIEAGQQGCAINPTINPEKTAAAFLTYSFGLRVTQLLAPTRTALQKDEFYTYMMNTLKP